MSSIDEAALQQLIDTLGGALALYARQWCRVPDDAVQEAFIELVRLNSVPTCPAAWLYTAVRRRAMNLGRSEQRREKHHRRASETYAAWFLPRHEQEEADDSAGIERLLTRLPEQDREIVVLRIWGGLTFEQIASVVDQSSSTVHRRYQQVLSHLGQMLRETDPSRQVHESKPTFPQSS